MLEYFDKTYGSGKFELVEVPDLAVKGSLNAAVKGAKSAIRNYWLRVTCSR